MAINFEGDVSNKTMSLITTIALFIFLPLLLYGSYQTAVLISRASGKPANIVVDVSTTLEPVRTDFFHAFSQGGEEPTDMLHPVKEELTELNPKLIRIDHIFDYYGIVSKSDNGLSYDFSKLDRSVDTIRSVGATPLLVLSYMPPSITASGNVIDAPTDWRNWEDVVRRTIEHYSGKNFRNIDGMYYEVWNEPDHEQFGGWHYSKGEQNYSILYEHAARGAQQAENVNAFFLGGPSTTGLYKNWILALVELANRGVRLDFLSWHSYYDDPARFAADQKNLIDWLLPYPQYVLLPKLITEFGFTGSKDPRYGTSFASAYTVAAIRNMVSGGPLFAFTFQPVDGPGQTNGDGWGLLTHPSAGKTKKPRYYVFGLLDEMEGMRINLIGEGTWVTGFASKRDQTIRVLLSNYDRFGNHVETVPVTFTNLLPGTYSYREILLSGRDNTIEESVTTNVLTKQVYMPAQSVVLLELTGP